MLPPENIAPKITNIVREFDGSEMGIGVWLRALRWKQWVKNVLIFLPLIFSHQWMQPSLIARALIAFAIYCLGASAIYLLNDVMDEAGDREHPEKRFRPLAAGLISRSACWIVSSTLLAFSIGAAVLLLPREFLAVYLLYVMAATAYSCGLKKVVMLDALMLTGFYTLRIFAGSVATGVQVSKWLLLFSMFFFLALAFQKRLSELRDWSEREEPLRRRGYLKEDLEHISMMGTSAGYLAVLVLALYIQSTDVTIHYARPGILWWICPCLLYWMSRLWLLAGRGLVTEDAISFAFRDKASYVVGLLVVVILILAGPI